VRDIDIVIYPVADSTYDPLYWFSNTQSKRAEHINAKRLVNNCFNSMLIGCNVGMSYIHQDLVCEYWFWIMYSSLV